MSTENRTILKQKRQRLTLLYKCANIGTVSTENRTNVKKIFKELPSNAVMTSKWLVEHGVNHDLQKRYERNGWFKRIGTGAYAKLDETFNIDGAIYALQSQLGLSIHIGAMTALNEKYGIMHNVPFNRKTLLFGVRGEKLPAWFKNHFKDSYKLISTDFLPKSLGMVEKGNEYFSTQIPIPERALLELVYLLPDNAGLKETYHIMETVATLRPRKIQELLENCSSIKTKRIFLFLAEKADMPWLGELDVDKIDLGKGFREINKGGIVDYKYQIVIDKPEDTI